LGLGAVIVDSRLRGNDGLGGAGESDEGPAINERPSSPGPVLDVGAQQYAGLRIALGVANHAVEYAANETVVKVPGGIGVAVAAQVYVQSRHQRGVLGDDLVDEVLRVVFADIRSKLVAVELVE
jgi:hypothetical protein